MARLPPFIALRALEAAARLKSYSGAAEELHVTHGAVSHQIRRLEEELGVRLFARQGNSMEPTPSASRLAAAVRQALETLHAGVAALRAEGEAAPLVVSADGNFAQRWLTRRLVRLREQTGEAHLELRLEDRLADFSSDGVDVGLRYGVGPWPGLTSVLLLEDALIPVCSPDFLQRHPLHRVEDLRGVPRLRHPMWDWATWFRRAGLEPPPEGPGLVFDDSSVLLQAAMEGLGVALARSSLAEPEIKAGRIVRPFDQALPLAKGFYVVWRSDSPKAARIARLRDWLLAEAAENGAGRLPTTSQEA